MSYTIVGLFKSQGQAKAISENLESKGFKNSDFIVYLTENKPAEKISLIKRLFTEVIDESATNVDSLIVSVAIKNDLELDLAKKSFAENDVVNIYELTEVDFSEATDLEYIKKVVTLKAKTQIYAMPDVKTSSSDISTGINAEVGS